MINTTLIEAAHVLFARLDQIEGSAMTSRQESVPAEITIASNTTSLSGRRDQAVWETGPAGFQVNHNPAPPHPGDGKGHVHAGQSEVTRTHRPASEPHRRPAAGGRPVQFVPKTPPITNNPASLRSTGRGRGPLVVVRVVLVPVTASAAQKSGRDRSGWDCGSAPCSRGRSPHSAVLHP
jgi:hypothetical protein